MPQAMPLTTKISETSSKGSVYKTLTGRFGDGYAQRAPDGTNNKIDAWDLKWSPLNLTDRNTVVAILDAVGGWDYITWTPPGESVSKKFVIISGYSESYVSTYYNISVKLEQVFNV